MKSIMDIIKKRYSVRSYLSDKPVPRKLINKCIEAARIAPSAENIQPWRYIVVDDKERLEELKQKAFNGIYKFTKWAHSAPVIIIILSKPNIITNTLGSQIQDINYHFIDVGIATEHLVLQATDLGLGTCWIGWFNVKNVRKLFKIPGQYKIVSLLSLGYYKHDEKLNRKRKKRSRHINRILSYNEFKKTF